MARRGGPNACASVLFPAGADSRGARSAGMKDVRVALAQVAPVLGDAAANLALHLETIDTRTSFMTPLPHSVGAFPKDAHASHPAPL